jgi:hypothetical protein
MTRNLARQAVFAAVWARKPMHDEMIHPDQGSAFAATEWQSLLGIHNPDAIRLGGVPCKRLTRRHPNDRMLSPRCDETVRTKLNQAGAQANQGHPTD